MDDPLPCGEKTRDMLKEASTLITRAAMAVGASERVILLGKARDVLYDALSESRRIERRERALEAHNRHIAGRLEAFRNENEGENI